MAEVNEFDGQTVLVGGGAGEIGAAVARRFARLGATVSIADVNEDRGRDVARELRALTASSEFVQVDLTRQSEVERWVQGVLARSGQIHVAVNTTGWTESSYFVDEDDAYWRRMIDINLMSCLYLAHAVIPSMTRHRYGRIVLVSASSCRVGRAKRAIYVTTKAGVVGFSKSLAREVAEDGITVNGVAPGSTETARLMREDTDGSRRSLSDIPIGKRASTEDHAHAVCFLASGSAGQITGQTIAVDGGTTMI